MPDKILVFGNGWIGRRIAEEFRAQTVRSDITDRSAIRTVLDALSPTVVVNAAGKTGRPNIDGCEDEPAQTLSVNTAGPILLAEECLARDIFMVHLGSGCVYDASRSGYTEEDSPNFSGSIYSRSKALSEAALKNLPVLQLRIRMPFDGMPHPRNFITKLVGYPRVIDVPNSLTYIDDFIVATECLIADRKTGVWNIVNPGAVSHSEVLGLYQKIVDPNHTFEVMPVEELSKITRAGRSNCLLDTGKLEREGIKMRPVTVALIEALKKYKERIA
jgi:dTDP-4-dehydrorhamnose reductase